MILSNGTVLHAVTSAIICYRTQKMSEPPPPYAYAMHMLDGKTGQCPPPAGHFFSSKLISFKRLFTGSASQPPISVCWCQHPPTPLLLPLYARALCAHWTIYVLTY